MNVPTILPSLSQIPSLNPSTMLKTIPTISPTTGSTTICPLRAKLGYPGWEDPDDATYFGYHSCWLEVYYDYYDYCDAWSWQERDWCTYENTNTTEGASMAYIGNVDDYYDDWASYADQIQEEIITIAAVADMTVNFHSYHWYLKEDWYYEYDCWNDHMMAAKLSIQNLNTGTFVRDEFGQFLWNHPVDEDIRTHLPNGDINPEYQGEFGISVTCDTSCNCNAHDYTTSWD